jgi:serine protease AprX
MVGLALATAACAATAAPAAANPATSPSSLYTLTRTIGAQDFWAAGITGKGVDIAVVDTGISPVDGLDGPDKVVFGPDLSFDSQVDGLRYLDGYGHGTHMAGIAAGRDPDAPLPPDQYVNRPDLFLGVAPDARILSVKAGDANGAVDVTQVIAAIDWVVAHRNSDGLNVRVINLSYGTDSIQKSELSPISHAVERAWKAGIFVVVAGGNEGELFPSKSLTPGLTTPARSPFIMAVGAATTNGTASYLDDDVASFSQIGEKERKPDIVAPGSRIASLRVPGSKIDELYGGVAAEDGRFIRGSGSSQAAAVVSGAAALLIQQRPTASLEQIRALLRQSVQKLDKVYPEYQGTGELDLRKALTLKTPGAYNPAGHWSNGTGLIDDARGSVRLEENGVELQGEVDVFGQPISASALASARTAGTVWTDGDWLGRSLVGTAWSTTYFGLTDWEARGWSARGWSGRGWTARGWSGQDWSARGWSGRGWTADGWTAGSWGDPAAPQTYTSSLWSSAGWR